MIDTEDRTVYVNQRMAEMLGYQPDEIIGRPVTDFLDAAEKAARSSVVEQYRAGISGQAERVLLRKDGQPIWTLVSANPLFGDDGVYRGAFAVMTDLTQRKATEAALRLTRFSLDESIESVIWCDDKGKILDANRRTLEVLGYTHGELMDKPVRTVFRPSLLGMSWSKLWEKLKDESAITTQCSQRRKDGTRFPVEAHANYVCFEGRDYACFFARDISERQASEVAVRESEERYRQVFQQSFDGIVITASTREITDVNASAISTIGYAKEELVGSTAEMFVIPAQREALYDLRSELNVSDVILREWQLMRKDGVIVDIEASNRKLSDDSIMTVLRDITERKRSQRERDRSQRMLVQAEEIADLGSWEVDLTNKDALWSNQCYRIFGIPEGTPLRIDSPVPFFHPDDQEIRRNSWNHAVEVSGVMDYEHRIIRSDGSIRTLWAKGHVEYSEDGEPIRVIGTSLDITDRKSVEQELQDRESRLRLLNHIATGVTAGMGIKDSIRNTLHLLANAFEGNRCTYSFVENNSQVTVFRSVAPPGMPDIRGTQWDLKDAPDYLDTLKSGQPLVIENTLKDESLSPYPEDFAHTRTVAVVVSPVRHGQTLVGLLTLESPNEKQWSQHEISTVVEVGEYLGIAMREARADVSRRQAMEEIRRLNADLHYQVEAQTAELRYANAQLEKRIQEHRIAEELILQRNKELSLLNSLSTAVRSSPALSDRLKDIARLLQSEYKDSAGCIFTYNQNTADIRLRRSWGLGREALKAITENPWRLCSIAKAVESRKAHLAHIHLQVDDIDETHAFPFLHDIHSSITIPLAAEGETHGAIVLMHRHAAAIGDQELEFFETLGQQIGSAIQNAVLFAQVEDSRDRLRALSKRIVDVQEEERRHIARELHDEIGQMLTGINYTIERAILNPDIMDMQALREAQDLVRYLLQQVRDISLDLRPAMLDDLGLLPAIEWFLARYQTQTGVEVAFECSGSRKRYTPEIETAAYRIVQEALTNAARHAQVKEVRVRLYRERYRLHVQVEDDGLGFNVDEALNAGASSGLAGMQERVQLLGGKLDILSGSAQGTTVSASLPQIGVSAQANPVRIMRNRKGTGS